MAEQKNLRSALKKSLNTNSPLRERLHKVIAASGLCSRREAELLISAGRVSVNGKKINKMGVKVTPKDRVAVDGKDISEKSAPVTLALHKPAGVLTSKKDPFHPETVMDLLPEEFQHLNPIGRLDKESEGLLLFTSDGALLEHLTHPRYGHIKTYQVLVQGQVTADDIEKLRVGPLYLDNYKLKPMEAKILSEDESRLTGKTYTWVEMKLSEGRKRQIRRVMELLGFPVKRLIRIAIGKVELGELKPGELRTLTSTELRDLYSK